MATGTIRYKKYQSTRTGVTNGKWYARVVTPTTVEFDDFVKHMADHNTAFSQGVISGVLTDMLRCLQELVLDGKAVRLGALGLVSIGINSAAAATSADWNTSLIKSVNLLVRNTKTWSNTELKKLANFREALAYAAADDATAEAQG